MGKLIQSILDSLKLTDEDDFEDDFDEDEDDFFEDEDCDCEECDCETVEE